MSNISGWRPTSLGELGSYVNGFPFAPSQLGDEGVPVIRIQQLNNPNGRYDFTLAKVPERNQINSGDLIFSWSGTLKVARWQHGFAYLNQHLFKVTPKEGVDKEFLRHSLDFALVELIKSAHGSTMKHIQRGELDKYYLDVPDSIGEQRGIAEVLSALDEQIEATERLIEKLTQRRKGLVQETLLPVTEASSTVALGEICSVITSGSRGWAQYYAPEGDLFIRIGNLTRAHPNLRFNDVVFVKPPISGEGLRTRLEPGDVLISITADLGIIACTPENLGPAYINQHIALARINTPEFDPRWVAHVLASPFGFDQISKMNDGGAKAGLNLPTIKALRIPQPSVEVQKEVAAILDAADTEIAAEQEMAEKLRRQKQGLMRDLLTGAVRVTEAN